MQTSKPSFKLRFGHPLPIYEISTELGNVSAVKIQHLLETALSEHYRMYGQTPYTLSYDRGVGGYVLNATSAIGFVDCVDFILRLEPKFQGLEIGKCLQLAHRAKKHFLVRHSNSVVEDEVSESDELEGVDYFAAVFISAITDVVNDGLLREHSFEEGNDDKLRGEILAEKHISMGSSPVAPYTRRPAFTENIKVNITLKTALQKIRTRSTIAKIQALASNYLKHFNGVSDNLGQEALTYDFKSSVNREDYKRALTFAKIILEGFDPSEGKENSFQPSFTIDLDKLFEDFVAYELKSLLSKELYKIETQKVFKHPAVPDITGRIIPDLYLTSIQEGKRSIVLDTKNKYSLLFDDKTLSISNSDLYQVSYYGLAIGSPIAVLVYPGNGKNATKYPIKGSEGDETYVAKRLKALKKIKEDPASSVELTLGQEKLNVYFWRVNLEGTVRDTLVSMAQLAMFLADGVNGKLDS